MGERGFWKLWDETSRVVRSALRHVPTLVVLTREERCAWRGMWQQENVRGLVRALPLSERVALERANRRLTAGVALVREPTRRLWIRQLFRGKIGGLAGDWLNENFPRDEKHPTVAAVNITLTRKLRTGSVSVLRLWEQLEEWPTRLSIWWRHCKGIAAGGV